MISIKILRPGCSKCRTLESKVKETVAKNNIEAEITKVEDITEMMSLGIMMTPGLVINKQVKSYDIVPKDEQILNWLKES
ncbi:MAG: thioredoxin family protein [Stygiobacter sp.]